MLFPHFQPHHVIFSKAITFLYSINCNTMLFFTQRWFSILLPLIEILSIVVVVVVVVCCWKGSSHRYQLWIVRHEKGYAKVIVESRRVTLWHK